MQKKLTITVDELVYDGLYRVVGPRRISQFIEDLVRPHVIDEDLLSAYAEMAADEVVKPRLSSGRTLYCRT
jgi:hypothetical protein